MYYNGKIFDPYQPQNPQFSNKTKPQINIFSVHVFFRYGLLGDFERSKINYSPCLKKNPRGKLIKKLIPRGKMHLFTINFVQIRPYFHVYTCRIGGPITINAKFNEE